MGCSEALIGKEFSTPEAHKGVNIIKESLNPVGTTEPRIRGTTGQ